MSQPIGGGGDANSGASPMPPLSPNQYQPLHLHASHHQQQQQQSQQLPPQSSYHLHPMQHHGMPRVSSTTSMSRVPSVGSLMTRVGSSDGLDMELYDIFSLASTSFDTDAPSPDYFSHTFPAAASGGQAMSSPQRPPSSTSHGSASFGARGQPANPPYQSWPAPAANAASANATPGATPAAAATTSLTDAYAHAAASPNVPMSDTSAAAAAPVPTAINGAPAHAHPPTAAQNHNNNANGATNSTITPPQQQQPQQPSLQQPSLQHTPNQTQSSLQQQQPPSAQQPQQPQQQHLPLQSPQQPHLTQQQLSQLTPQQQAQLSSPFLLQYMVPPPALLGAALTPEQQQRLYADFVAGKHLNSFNALPPTNPLHFQPSHPSHSGGGAGGSAMSSDVSDDDDSDDDMPSGRKRGRSGMKLESTPASAHFNSPYYKPGSSISDAAYEAMGGDPNDKERLGKRLARKAELARASRRRKKMYVQDLESKVKKLGQKIEELQAKASSSRSKASSSLLLDEEAQRKSAQQTIRATMSALLSRPEGVDAEGTQRIHELVRQFVENSRERQSQVETYLDRVEESLTPGLQSKFAMWGLDQNDDFYSKPGLWTSLMSKEIGLTPQQLATILSKRPAIHQERKNLATCELMIKELRAAAGQHLRSLHQTMDEVQTVMTPTQLAKFYLWVENNEWTMQMLNQSLGFSSSSARATQQP